MSRHRSPFVLAAAAVTVAAALAACGGGGGGGGTSGGLPPPVPTPTPTPVTSQQVVTMALPTSVMGSRTDATFGLIGGYTQQTYSQVLAFAPGSQIMVHNGQGGSTAHTLGVVSTTGFDSGAALNTSATGGSTIAAGFNTGTVLSGADAGPFTLTAGTYYIGCAFHYASNAMRTVLLVAAGATPGPQATPPVPNATPSPGKTGY